MSLLSRAVPKSVAYFVMPLMLLVMPAQGVEWPDSPEPANSLGPEVWIGAPIQGDSPCEILFQRVCGESGACAGEPVCEEVRQILESEQQQRAASDKPDRMTYASGQCQEADGDRARYRACSR